MGGAKQKNCQPTSCPAARAESVSQLAALPEWRPALDAETDDTWGCRSDNNAGSVPNWLVWISTNKINELA
jgi:hypothetical protein